MVLQDNGGDNLSVATAGTSFTFATALPVGATYAVTVATQPTNPAASCTVANGTGTIVAGNVTSVTVNCVGVGRYVYVVNSAENGNPPGDIAAFTINQSTGALTANGSTVTGTTTPTGIAIDPVGNMHTSATKTQRMSRSFILAPRCADLKYEFRHQRFSEAFIAIAPSNQYVFAGGYNGVWGFNLASSTGVLTSFSGAHPYAGSADRDRRRSDQQFSIRENGELDQPLCFQHRNRRRFKHGGAIPLSTQHGAAGSQFGPWARQAGDSFT